MMVLNMYSEPLAYFLTFTVRGSWRHGDDRGSWQRHDRVLAPGTQVYAEPNRQSPHFFSEDEQRIVAEAVREQCEIKKWTLHEMTVQQSHVHVVVSAADTTPETVMKLLKAKATQRLRQHGSVKSDEKIWTQHGSTRYLFNDQSFAAACDYVRNHESQPEDSPPKF